MLNASRTLGSKSALCQQPQPLGRLVIGENLTHVHSPPSLLPGFLVQQVARRESPQYALLASSLLDLMRVTPMSPVNTDIFPRI